MFIYLMFLLIFIYFIIITDIFIHLNKLHNISIILLNYFFFHIIIIVVYIQFLLLQKISNILLQFTLSIIEKFHPTAKLFFHLLFSLSAWKVQKNRKKILIKNHKVSFYDRKPKKLANAVKIYSFTQDFVKTTHGHIPPYHEVVARRKTVKLSIQCCHMLIKWK